MELHVIYFIGLFICWPIFCVIGTFLMARDDHKRDRQVKVMPGEYAMILFFSLVGAAFWPLVVPLAGPVGALMLFINLTYMKARKKLKAS